MQRRRRGQCKSQVGEYDCKKNDSNVDNDKEDPTFCLGGTRMNAGGGGDNKWDHSIMMKLPGRTLSVETTVPTVVGGMERWWALWNPMTMAPTAKPTLQNQQMLPHQNTHFRLDNSPSHL